MATDRANAGRTRAAEHTALARPLAGARAIVVMGVSGCGKSSIGQRIATRLGWAYVEGDDLHPAANVRKMSSGTPLRDADRWPWLDAVGHAMRDSLAADDGPSASGVVATCSALRRAYRERLNVASGESIAFVLLDGSMQLIAQRMQARERHFMPTSLLRSQFETLERPARDERAMRVDVAGSPDAIAESVVAQVHAKAAAISRPDAQ